MIDAFKPGSKALACGAAFLLFSGFATAGPFFPAWDRINPNQSAMPIQDRHHIGPIGSVGPKVKPRSEAPGCPLYDDSGVVVGWSLGCQIPAGEQTFLTNLTIRERSR